MGIYDYAFAEEARRLIAIDEAALDAVLKDIAESAVAPVPLPDGIVDIYTVVNVNYIGDEPGAVLNMVSYLPSSKTVLEFLADETPPGHMVGFDLNLITISEVVAEVEADQKAVPLTVSDSDGVINGGGGGGGGGGLTDYIPDGVVTAITNVAVDGNDSVMTKESEEYLAVYAAGAANVFSSATLNIKITNKQGLYDDVQYVYTGFYKSTNYGSWTSLGSFDGTAGFKSDLALASNNSIAGVGYVTGGGFAILPGEAIKAETTISFNSGKLPINIKSVFMHGFPVGLEAAYPASAPVDPASAPTLVILPSAEGTSIINDLNLAPPDLKKCVEMWADSQPATHGETIIVGQNFYILAPDVYAPIVLPKFFTTSLDATMSNATWRIATADAVGVGTGNTRGILVDNSGGATVRHSYTTYRSRSCCH